MILRDNRIIINEVVANGRNILMTEIRKKMFKDHKPIIRLRSDRNFEKLIKDELTDELFHLGEHKSILAEHSTTMLKELRYMSFNVLA